MDGSYFPCLSRSENWCYDAVYFLRMHMVKSTSLLLGCITILLLRRLLLLLLLLLLLHPFNGLFSRTAWASRHQKGKPFWILLEQETMVGNGVSWTVLRTHFGYDLQFVTSAFKCISFFSAN